MKHHQIVIPLVPLFGKSVPHDPEAEATIVGTLFWNPVFAPDIFRALAEEDFYDPKIAHTFAACKEVFLRTRTIEHALVLSELNPEDRVERAIYLNELITSADGTESVWEHFAKIVKDKSRARKLIKICAEAAHLAYTASDEINQSIATTFEKVAQIARNDSQSDVVQLVDAADQVIEMMASGNPLNLRTGISAFDNIAGGVPKSGVWAIFAPPNAGKTTFALRACINMAMGLPASGAHPAQAKRVVRYFSVEQPAVRAAATILSQDTGRSVHDLINNFKATKVQVDETTEARLKWGVVNFGFFQESKDPNQLFAECLALSTKHEHGVLVMDYIQDTPPFDRFIDQTPRIAESMRILSRIARELGWLVIVVSQIDKASSKANQSPKLTDGIGSSSIEQRADVISYVWRPNQREVSPPYELDEFQRPTKVWQQWFNRNRRVRIGIIKSKYGACGVADMMYTGKSMNFVEPPDDVKDDWMVIEEI